MKQNKLHFIFLFLLFNPLTSIALGVENHSDAYYEATAKLQNKFEQIQKNGRLHAFRPHTDEQKEHAYQYLKTAGTLFAIKEVEANHKKHEEEQAKTIALKNDLKKKAILEKKHTNQYPAKIFNNFSVGFELTLEGDFDKDFIINASLIGSCNTGPVGWQARIDLNNDNIIPQIKAYPCLKAHKNISPTSAIFYSTTANIALGSLAAIYHKELERKLTNQYEDYYEKRCIEEVEKGDIVFKQAEKDLYHV